MGRRTTRRRHRTRRRRAGNIATVQPPAQPLLQNQVQPQPTIKPVTAKPVTAKPVVAQPVVPAKIKPLRKWWDPRRYLGMGGTKKRRSRVRRRTRKH